MKYILLLAVSLQAEDIKKSVQFLYQVCNAKAMGEIFENATNGRTQDLNSPSITCARSCQVIVYCIGVKDSIGKECSDPLNSCISAFKVATKK